MKIIKATDADIQQLGLVLGGVFRAHPMMRYMIDDAEKRKRATNWLNERAVAFGMAYGTVFTDEGRNGVSVIMSSEGGGMTVPRMVRHGLYKAPFKMGWGGFRKFMKFSSQTEAIRKRLMPDPHHIMLSIGVKDEMQGRGLGTALLEAGFKVFDAAGQDAYVETFFEKNVPWYDSNGYKVVEENEFEGVGTLWSMVRKAGR